MQDYAVFPSRFTASNQEAKTPPQVLASLRQSALKKCPQSAWLDGNGSARAGCIKKRPLMDRKTRVPLAATPTTRSGFCLFRDWKCHYVYITSKKGTGQ